MTSLASLSSRSLPVSRAGAFGYLLLRLALGVNMFAHGLARFGANYDKFIAWSNGLFAPTPVPAWMVGAFTHAVPPLETIIGLLLILGLFTEATLMFGGLLMICLIFGMAMVQNWEIVGVQMIYVAFYGGLLLLEGHNRFSLDRWRRLPARKAS